ncbi:hypothetical protein Micbo1qcDRAFT_172228 [Microdochium bolleyi]|uniref:Uncharacterized protein n=1 Tax=Microdochium bolleyi TaxID=196109 RepID=A0A136JFM3_9PEZI|nr:hypothetical protein Micbo1qcDRAFT_172228 [Microdochium bolleyi]
MDTVPACLFQLLELCLHWLLTNSSLPGLASFLARRLSPHPDWLYITPARPDSSPLLPGLGADLIQEDRLKISQSRRHQAASRACVTIGDEQQIVKPDLVVCLKEDESSLCTIRTLGAKSISHGRRAQPSPAETMRLRSA